ncbi:MULTISPECIES: primase C-terminal domain-containing protein [Aeromonas]|uniref:primase C-terminal domain-containing protein n=1 Tax=Aeromonas TaxID=642 RepID=UPI0013776B7E|nr:MULTISPECIES: primase C-terminal domain-containing protein [Aeromonas]
MNQPIHEKDFQTLFDTAGKILEATYTDEQLTRQAIQALNQTRERLERRLNLLAQEVEHTITSSASSTATAAANLIYAKFTEADSAAEQATRRYHHATKTLGWRLFGGAMLLQICLFAGLWLFLNHTLPSYEEIQTRRQEIGLLKQQLAVLESKGANIVLTQCLDEDSQRKYLCIRTDERKHRASLYGGEEETYRIPFGY